jgi:hypothetical protein
MDAEEITTDVVNLRRKEMKKLLLAVLLIMIITPGAIASEEEGNEHSRDGNQAHLVAARGHQRN